MRRKASVAFLGLVAVLTLAVVGVGAAGAQTATNEADNAYDRFVNRVGELLGKQPAQVRSAMTQASKELVDQAVKDGDLTQEQADDMKERIEESGRPFPIFRHPHGRRFGHHRGVFGEITKVSGSTLTVETPDGNRTVKLTDDTEVRDEGQQAQASAIKVGSTVRVIGEANDEGVVTAKAVLIGEPVGRGFHRGRGHHHGPWGGQGAGGDGADNGMEAGSSADSQ
ncbi:MAG: DUF5666 domain-containing protein [Chloroflexota bacterium]|nr:DUF5666 domain-containing protein [Chloroflexota bacterium]